MYCIKRKGGIPKILFSTNSPYTGIVGVVFWNNIDRKTFFVNRRLEIDVWKNGKIKLTSLRKTIDTKVEDMAYVQGPQLPIGFIKLRLEREKTYLFAKMGNHSLNKVLAAIKTADPGIKFDRIKKY